MMKTYLRYRKAPLMASIAAGALVLLVNWIQGIPNEGVLYSMVILTFVSLLYMAYDVHRLSQKLGALAWVRENLGGTLPPLPEETDPVGIAYREILLRHQELVEREIREGDAMSLNQTEYYTMWIHQIKSPIAGLKLVLDDMEDPSGSMEMALFDIERYADMALQFTKMDTLSSDLILKKEHLSDVLSEVVRKYSIFFIYRRIRLEMEEMNVVTTTDRKWLAFILEQLLSNSLKYTKEGTVRIFMKDGKLVVEDTGIGIRAEDLPRVFERGYTGFNGRMDRNASGLGLYMARKAALQMGMDLSIASEEGKGTRVSISFPKDGYLDFE
jgi:hypothetical protein